MVVHSALPDSLTRAVAEVLDQAGIEHVAHGEAGVRACVSKPVRQSALYNAFVTAIGQALLPSPDVNAKRKDADPLRPTAYRLLLAEDNRVNSRWRWEC